MKKTLVTIENYPEAYRVCRATKPDAKIVRRIGQTARALFRPRLSYITPDAEKSFKAINEQKKGVVIGSKHVSHLDPAIFAGAAMDTPLEDRFDELRALAKDSLFRGPFRNLMAWHIPVFRPIDYPRDAIGGPTRELLRTSKDVLENQGLVAVYPEGTCRSDIPKEVGELQAGIRGILSGGRDIDAYFMPVGAYYGEHRFKWRVGGSIAVGQTVAISDLSKKPKDLMNDVQKLMQDAQNHAVKMY